MAKLLNTSLRERHWQYLMKKTGYECDLNPERFRLADIFAMDLYKYQVRQIKWLLWAFKVKKSIFDFCSDTFPINTAMEKNKTTARLMSSKLYTPPTMRL